MPTVNLMSRLYRWCTQGTGSKDAQPNPNQTEEDARMTMATQREEGNARASEGGQASTGDDSMDQFIENREFTEELVRNNYMAYEGKTLIVDGSLDANGKRVVQIYNSQWKARRVYRRLDPVTKRQTCVLFVRPQGVTYAIGS